MRLDQLFAALFLAGVCTRAEAIEAAQIIDGNLYADTADGWIDLVEIALQVVRDRRHERYVELTRVLVDDAAYSTWERRAQRELATIVSIDELRAQQVARQSDGAA